MEDGERELITALYPALRRIAAVAGSVDIEPDDLVQEALMRVLRKGSISDLDNPLAYLRKTIVNLASNQRRSLGRRRKAVARLSVEESWLPSYPADIEAILDLPRCGRRARSRSGHRIAQTRRRPAGRHARMGP
jgi:DNA-directed RNA polymerase specialized sigma24 family protein